MLDGLRQRLHRLRALAAGPRALLLALIAWVPPLLLAADPTAPLHHVASYARFLVAIPLLVLAERLLGPRVREASEQVLRAGLVAADDRPRAAFAQESLARIDASPATALACLGLAYIISLTSGAANLPPWARLPAAPGALSAAGGWLELISLPIFWYLLLRRVAGFLTWAVFLFRISRVRLDLLAAHPDRVGGLAFLAEVQSDFGLVLLAVGLVISTTWWQAVAEGVLPAAALVQTAVGYVLGSTAIALLPLMVFMPHLRQLKWRGELEYGRLASRYVHAFARRWLGGSAPDDGELLGTPDLQSLADLINAVGAARSVQRIPITREAATRLALLSGLSMLPLALAAAPLEAIARALLKALL